MNDVWLNDDDWRFIQKNLPIACVDIIPFRRTARKSIEIGLIWRDTPYFGARWCLLGGRLFLNESMFGAIQRQIKETLGSGAKVSADLSIQPIFVAQYFSEERSGELYDPRQHAVGLTFAVAVDGDLTASGEALKFKWFQIDKIPEDSLIGFGQSKLLKICLRKMKAIK